jgi:hypothetical protein
MRRNSRALRPHSAPCSDQAERRTSPISIRSTTAPIVASAIEVTSVLTSAKEALLSGSYA